MKNNHFVRILLILVISTSYIFSFTFFSTNVFESFFEKNPLFDEGTKVASQDVSNKTKSASAKILADAVKQWKKNTKITFSYKEKEAEVETGFYEFEPDETVKTIKNGQDNSMVVNISVEALQEELSKVSPGLSSISIDYDRLNSELVEAASNLQISEYSYDLDQFVVGAEANEVISVATVSLDKPQVELEEFVSAYPSIELQGMTIFSLLSYLEEQGRNNYSEKTLSIVATGLFGAVLPSNFTVLERHISKELPSYSKLGYEAKVSQEQNMDLMLSNDNIAPYTFELSYESNRLSVVLRGSPFLYRYEISEEEVRVFEPKTIVQFDNRVPSGKMILQKTGENGQMIKLYRVIYDELGSFIRNELVADDFYAPIHQVLYQGLVVPPASEPNPEEEALPEDEEPAEEPEQDTETDEDGADVDEEEEQDPSDTERNSAEPPLDDKESK